MTERSKFNWSSRPIGLGKNSNWSWADNFFDGRSLIVDRRRFLQTTLATTIAVPIAWQSVAKERPRTIALQFDLSEDKETVTVRLVDVLLREVHDGKIVKNVNPEKYPSWKLHRAAFGPNAYFRLAPGIRKDRLIDPNKKTSRSGSIKLHIENISLGRLGPSRLSYIFQYDEGKNQEIPPLERWKIRATSRLWLGPRGGTKLRNFGRKNDPRKGIALSEFIAGADASKNDGNMAAKLHTRLSADACNCSLMDIFNGLARVDRGKGSVDLSLGPLGIWLIKPDKTALRSLTNDIILPDLRIGWVKNVEEAIQTTQDAENLQRSETNPRPGATSNDEQTIAVLGAPTFGPGEPIKINIPGSNETSISLSAPEGLRVLMVSSQVETPKFLGPDQDIEFRANGAAIGRFDLSIGETGPFRELTGLFRRWVDAPASHKPGSDPMGLGDEFIFYGGAPGSEENYNPRETARIVNTRFGEISFAIPPAAVVSPSQPTKEPKKNKRPEGPFDKEPFGHHSRSPIFLRNIGNNWQLDKEQRSSLWLEINGQLVEMYNGLPDASLSSLKFHPTDLVFFHQPQKLETAPRNYILLENPEPEPPKKDLKGTDGEVVTQIDNTKFGMRIDLSSARLDAARTRDLISLKFGFRDLFLTHDGEYAAIRPQSDACGIHAKAPGLVGRPGTATRDITKPERIPEIHDTRPVLVVEFPPQHILEEAFFRPGPPPLPDLVHEGSGENVLIKKEIVDNKVTYSKTDVAGDNTFRADNAGAIERELSTLNKIDARVSLRTAVRSIKMDWAGSKENENTKDSFKKFIDLFNKMSRLPPNTIVPADQKIYIGPLGMDPDVAAQARLWQVHLRKDHAELIVEGMFEAVKHQLKLLKDKISGLALEAKLESTVPTYQLFRSFYRERMAELALGLRDPAKYIVKLETEEKPFPINSGSIPDIIEYFHESVLEKQGRALELSEFFKFAFITDLLAIDEYRTVEGRLANPSRLAFRVNCMDGLTQARNKVNAPWLHDLQRSRAPLRVENVSSAKMLSGAAAGKGLPGFVGEHPASIGVDYIPFSLAGLTDWTSMELAVIDRAQEVFLPGPGGRLDNRSKRQINLLGSAALDHLGFLPGSDPQDRKWNARGARIAESLRHPPSPYETAIELPARLTLSPSQRAAFRTPRGIEPAIYNEKPTLVSEALKEELLVPEQMGEAALWHARLMLDDTLGNPKVRAVHSPDIAPDFVNAHARARGFARPENDPHKGKFFPVPGGGAPPRGPFAPWLLGKGRTSAADLTPGQYATWVSAHNADIEPPESLLNDKDEVISAELCEAGPIEQIVKNKDGSGTNSDYESIEFRKKLPLMIDELCRRFLLRNPKGNVADINDADPQLFRSSLDAFDRHELVLLSSAYGLPVRPNGTNKSTIPGTGANQFEPDEDYQLIDILPGSEIYRPRALNISELTLTALGGSLVHDTHFEPPAAARHADGKNLFDSLSIEHWQHRTSLGRDIFCEVVYKGYLFPFMFRAALVKVTERVFEPIRSDGTVHAFLRQRMYIRCAEPEKNFPLVGQPDKGRAFPPGLVKLLTTTTPDIVDPNAVKQSDSEDTQILSEHSTGLLSFKNVPGLVFWPRTLKSPEGDVRFQLRIGDSATDLPLLFVDNVAVNDDRTLGLIRDYYNDTLNDDTLGVESPDNADANALTCSNAADSGRLRKFKPTLHRRSMAFSSARIRYTEEEKSGSASLETDLITIRAEGRRIESSPNIKIDPCLSSGSGSFTAAEKTDDIKQHILAGKNHVYDALLRGADQPPIYPAIETTRVRLKQNEVLTRQQGQVYRAFYDGHYVQYGYGIEPVAKGAVDSSNDLEARKNGLDVFLTLLDPASQRMSNNGEQSGGIFQPSAKLIAVSRRKGPVASSLYPINMDALKMLREGDRLGIAPYFGTRDSFSTEKDIVVDDGTPQAIIEGDPIKSADSLNTEKIRSVLQDIFSEAKLLGLVELRKIIEFIGQDLLTSVEENAPALQEVIQFGASVTEKAEAEGQKLTDYVRTQILEPLSGLAKDAIKLWETQDRELQALQANQFDIASVTIQELFPELDSALRGFDKAVTEAIAEADPIAFAIALSVVYERGQALIDAIRRAAANAGERFELALKNRIGKLDAVIKGMIGGLSAAGEKMIEETGNQLAKKLAGYLADVLVTGKDDDEPYLSLQFPVAPLIRLKKLAGTDFKEYEALFDPAILYNKDAREFFEPALEKVFEDLVNKGRISRTTQENILKGAIILSETEIQKQRVAANSLTTKLKNLKPGLAAEVKSEIELYEKRIIALEKRVDDIVTDPESLFEDPLIGPLIIQYHAPYIRIRKTVDDSLLLVENAEQGDIQGTLKYARIILDRHFAIDLPAVDINGQLKPLLEALRDIVRIGPVKHKLKKPIKELKLVREAVDNIAIKYGSTDLNSTHLSKNESGIYDGKVVTNEQLLAMLELNNTLNALNSERRKINGLIENISDSKHKERAIKAFGVFTSILFGKNNEIDGLHSSNAQLLIDLLNDANMLFGIEARLEKSLQGNLVKNLHLIRRDVDILIAARKAALKRLLSNINETYDQLNELFTNKDAQAIIGAAGIVGIGWESDLIGTRAKDWFTNTSIALARVTSLHGQRITTYAKAQLDKGLDAVETTAPQIQTLLPNFGVQVLSPLQEHFANFSGTLGNKSEAFRLIYDEASKTPPGTLPIKKLKECVRKLQSLASKKSDIKGPLVVLEEDLQRLFDISEIVDQLEARLRDATHTRLDNLLLSILNAEKIPNPSSGNSGNIHTLFGEMLKLRNEAFDDLKKLPLGSAPDQLLITPTQSAFTEFEPAKPGEALTTKNDRLAGDAAWLEHVSDTATKNPFSDKQKRAYLVSFVRDFTDGTPTPILIGRQLADFMRKLLRGDISLTDLINIRETIEAYILDLVPAKIEHRFDVALPLPEAVKDATLGIFAPQDGCALTIGALISVNLLEPEIKTQVEGHLGAFDIKLVGTVFDALTLKFAGAQFKTKEGGGHDFNIVYLDYEIGPQLEFIQQLQTYLSPKEGSGFYITGLSYAPGIEAGYKLDLGVISIGAVSFFNVNLNTAALLPFSNGGEAVFRAGLASPTSPFTISFLPYGGAGFVSIYANARGIIGLELGFDFGAAGAFAVGPLTGQGRIMAGLYIRTMSPPNQPKISEISATFFAGGSANIWIFNFSASLYVKLGMVNGDMTGLAIFTFSFSMGIADYDFSISFERTENKGYSGGSGGTADASGDSRTRFASIAKPKGNDTKPGVNYATDETVAQIQADTTCLSEDWRNYVSYFDPSDVPAGVINYG